MKIRNMRFGILPVQNCTCEIQFTLDCPPQCGCTALDIVQFGLRVQRGFSKLYRGNSCAAMFTPVYITNALGHNQGVSETYSYAQMDNFCFNGTIVATSEIRKKESIRINPNPTNGHLTIELPEVALQEMVKRGSKYYGTCGGGKEG